MTRHKLLLGAAVMALMIGGTSSASAQYYRDYKPNDKPAVEVDMSAMGGSSEPQGAPAAPGYVAPVAREVLASETSASAAATPARERIVSQPPAASTPAVTRVLKPSGPAPAGQSVRSYPPAPTTKPYNPTEAPAEATAEPYRPYLTTPAGADTAPLPQPVQRPAAAKQYQPSPSVVDDASYKPDYSGYYKSGAPVPAAVANIEAKPAEQPAPRRAADELTEQLPEPQSTPQLDPLPEIVTERSIEQTPPPATPMEPVYSPPAQQGKIVSYPDGSVTTRKAAPVAVKEPEEKIVSLPTPQRKPAPAHRPSLEILNTPAPERPAADVTESIIPPVKEEAKTDISKLAEQVDGAAAEMAAPPAPVEPPQFASVPVHSDLMLEFPGNSSDLTTATQRKLDAIARQLEDLDDGGRLQVRGYAAGEDGSKSSARRIALSRALSVRSYLMDKGVKAKRVDVRAMGSETDRNPLDRVDLIFQR